MHLLLAECHHTLGLVNITQNLRTLSYICPMPGEEADRIAQLPCGRAIGPYFATLLNFALVTISLDMLQTK